MSDLANDIQTAITYVGKDWKKAKKAASDYEDKVHRQRLSYMRHKPPQKTLKDVVYKHMPEAYNKASSNGRYYANARQIMYAARPLIIEEMGLQSWNSKTPKYFIQTLLKDYIEEHGDDMKVVWDARGHFEEPHNNYRIGLGGAEIMAYRLDQNSNFSEAEEVAFKQIIKTVGPTHRYGAILFIEKEGFNEQIADAGIQEKWDIALMSSKGVPNAATCNVGAFPGVPVLAFHDFDVAGFKIVKTLREGARLSSGICNLIDIGLRLDDVKDIDPEPVDYTQDKTKLNSYLRLCGATEEERKYLVNNRVEINMFTSEELIQFLEMKFEQHGIKKVIPDEEVLRSAYKRAAFCQELEVKAKEFEINDDDLIIPDNLYDRIKDSLDDDRMQSWDQAIWSLAANKNNGDC